MRLIESMTEAMGQIMQLRRERKQEEAALVIDELLDKHFGLSGKLLRSLSDEDLMAVMTTNGILETDKLQAVAVLFKQQADLQEELGNGDESYALRLKSLHLFMRLSLAGAPATIADSAKEAEGLLEQLKDYELPVATKRLQAEWREGEGQFDLAENQLYELYEDGILDREELDGFYRRLLLYGDEKLEAGGLPREEIESGLAALDPARKE